MSQAITNTTRSMLWVAAALVTFGSAELGAQDYGEVAAYADDYVEGDPLIDARVWFDRGSNEALDPGQRVRVYYRTSEDAYVAVFQIDTDGFTRLVFPESPRQNHYVRGGRDYRLLFPRSPYWQVDDAPGVGYYFIVASAAPLDFSQVPYSTSRREWDLRRIGAEVRSDPFLAMDEYVERLVPDWDYGEYGLDYVEYSVGRGHTYPRFMCYDCHGYRPYSAWNPYVDHCTTFRVVVWDDPFYYPTRRYRGDRVVFVGRRPGTRPRFEFKERAGGDRDRSPLVLRRDGPGDRSAVRRGGVRTTAPSVRDGGAGQGDAARRAQPRGVTGTPRGAVVRPGTQATPRRQVPNVRTRPSDGVRARPQLQRRPRSSGATQAQPRTRSSGTDRARPEATRRPPSTSGSGSRGAVVRPGRNVRPGASATTRPPETRRSQPEARVRPPGQSQTRRSQPEARQSRPEARQAQPRARPSQPQARPSRTPPQVRSRPAQARPRVTPKKRKPGG